ncbi:MAG: hypothetical protein V3S37_03485, partial [Dehalococcoidia bacterium]
MAHSNPHWEEVSVDDFTRDTVDRHVVTTPRYRLTLWITGSLFLAGIAGFVGRALIDGFDDRLPWGYFAATVAFLLTTAGSAPLVVVALRMVRAHWRRPLARVSELYASVGLLTALMFIPLLFLVPVAMNRFTLWFQGDTQGSVGRIPGTPHVYISLLLAMLFICGLAMLLFSARPDVARIRDLKGGTSKSWASRWAAGWYGTRKQWLMLRLGLGVLGGFYFLLLIGTLSLFSVDFALVLVPGWKDAIFPAFQSLTGLQAGLATVVLTLYLMRRYGGLERDIHMEHFWGASKLLLALSLLWFYFWFSG